MSPRIILKKTEVEMQPGETVLAALQRAGIPMLYSCESGYCHGCILRGIGNIPPRAQNGLPDVLKECGCFLACQCVPTEGERPVPA
jgi:CDP-4-dehydro-6-deoxyglucose reductase